MSLLPSAGKFGNGLLEGFLRDDYQKDFGHAAGLFQPNDMAFAPNTKFNFHVYFTLADPKTNPNKTDAGIIGSLVKSVKLPSYKLDTKEYIQYNRKRLVHNRIQYDPVTIRMHDDAQDTIRSLWYNYYQYYFADPSYDYDIGLGSPVKPKKTGPAAAISSLFGSGGGGGGGGEDTNGPTDYNTRDLYNETQSIHPAGWGVTIASGKGTAKPAFFKDITIFGLSRGNFMSYTLINPIITGWDHDTYDYSDTNGTMEHTMTLRYEAVKYTAGKIQDSDGVGIQGLGTDSRYDRKEGPFGKSGDAQIDGLGNPVNSVLGTLKDLAAGNVGNVVKSGVKAVKILADGGPGAAKDALLKDAGGILKGAAISNAGNVFPTGSNAKSSPNSASSDIDLDGDIFDG